MAPRSATLLSGVFALLALEAAAQDLESTRPWDHQCTAAQYAYTCPEPPCTVVARPSNDPSKTMHNFGSVSDASGSVAWTPIDQKEGTAYTMWITDSKGTTISSASVSVAAGSDDSCLGGSGGSKSSAGDKGSASASATSDKKSPSSGKEADSTASASGSGHAKSAGASAASSAASGAPSAVSGAISSARVAASTAASALESGASQASGAAASASASDTPDDESGAGSLVLKGSILGATLLGASFALL
ncbi:hypothetical protein JCM11641_003466 [Rhodosporidiobolus odoratus]